MPRLSVEKREKRDLLAKEMKALLDAAEKDPAGRRGLNSDEETRFAGMESDLDRLDAEIDREEKDFARRERVDRVLSDNQRSAWEPRDVRPPVEHERSHEPDGWVERRDRDFRRALRSGHVFTWEFESRALTAGDPTAAGALLQPDAFLAELLKDTDNEVFLRSISRKFQVARAQAIGAPRLTTRAGAAQWGGELTAPTIDSTMKVGRRNLYPHPLIMEIDVSKTLLEAGGPMAPEQVVRNEIAYTMGIGEEQGFMTGTGASQPLGIFTASDDGVSTSRDQTTDVTTTIGADDVISMIGAIKDQYLRDPSLYWVMHRDTKTKCRKLKAADGHYLWATGITAGQSLGVRPPEMLEGIPICTSEYAPNTYTANQYVMVLGCFRWYWIVDALTFRLQRCVELGARTNTDAFIARAEVDGAPVVAEAFARMKLKS